MNLLCRSAVLRASALVLASAFAFALPHGAFAQSSTSTSMDGLKLNSDQPIQIESDLLEIREQEKIAVFTGNVKALQGTTALQAGKMIVHYKDKAGAAADASASTSVASGSADIDTIDVTEKVFLSSGTQQATADTGHFDMAAQTFTLEGDRVVLSEGQNVFVGCKLTVHMETGEARLDSCGRRVQIQLDPKSQQQQKK